MNPVNEILKTIFDGAEKLAKAITETESEINPETKTDRPEILTANKIRELSWLDVQKLGVIYGYGKKPVKIQDSPAAYKELFWLTPGQIAAIFGTEEKSNERTNPYDPSDA